MADNKKVVYNIDADSGSFKREMKNINNEVKSVDKSLDKWDDSIDKANSSAKQMDKSIGGISSSLSTVAIGVGAVTTGIVALGNATTTYAAQLDVVNAAYGENMAAATEYFQYTSEQLGITERAFANSAAAMSLTAQNYGMKTDAANQYGAAVATLSGILSSYLGLPMEETSGRITAAMRGEAESAEALGLTLNETAVASYAAANGASTLWADMTDLEKMQWRLYTAISQTAGMLGVEVGEINSVETATAALSEMTEVASGNVTNFQTVMTNLKNVLNEVLLAITPLVEGFFALIMVLVQLIKQILTTVIPVLATALTPVIQALTPLVIMLFNAFKTLWDILAPFLVPILQTLSQLLIVLGEIVAQLITALWPLFYAFKSLADLLMGFLKPALLLANNMLQLLIPLLQIISAILSPLITLISLFVSAIVTAATVVADFLLPLDVLAKLLNNIYDFFIDVTNAIWDFVSAISEAITGVLDFINPFKNNNLDANASVNYSTGSIPNFNQALNSALMSGGASVSNASQGAMFNQISNRAINLSTTVVSKLDGRVVARNNYKQYRKDGI